MSLEKTGIISAQVVLKSASGTSLGSAPITAETLRKFVPSPQSVEAAQKYFREHEFQVSDMVGISFSITGAVSNFESLFNVHLGRMEGKGIQAISADGSASYELPTDKLPPALGVDAVTFTPPPDFGPTNF